MMRQSKMKYDIVLKDKTLRLESTLTVTGEKQRLSSNSTVANDMTKSKPERHLVALCAPR